MRCGSANLFCAVKPKAGWHFVKATRCLKALGFSWALGDLARHHAKVRRIHIVLYNLITHGPLSLTRRFDRREGMRLWRRFRIHYTPNLGI